MAHWIARLDDKGTWAPFWLGVSITIGFLLLRCAFDGFFLATWGFPQGFYPLWQSGGWWTEIVNAALIGYIPAALAMARRGIDRDLGSLRPWLPLSDAEVANIRADAIRPAGLVGRAFIIFGLVGAFVNVFVDPSLSGAGPSLSNPGFMWPLFRIPVFILLLFILIVSDVNATRTYFYMGRNLIEVDLLDVQSLSPFARRGLRSALTWILFLIVFSLFWLGEDTASRQNPILFAAVLVMATAAFVVPLVGVHNNVLSVKRSELDRLSEEIRDERTVVTGEISNENPVSPKLANLVAYYQFIDQAREWPIDAANLLRFVMYMLIGLGSWLGGAVVERLLDQTLGG